MIYDYRSEVYRIRREKKELEEEVKVLRAALEKIKGQVAGRDGGASPNTDIRVLDLVDSIASRALTTSKEE